MFLSTRISTSIIAHISQRVVCVVCVSVEPLLWDHNHIYSNSFQGSFLRFEY